LPRYNPPKCPFPRGIRVPLNAWFLQPAQVCVPNHWHSNGVGRCAKSRGPRVPVRKLKSFPRHCIVARTKFTNNHNHSQLFVLYGLFVHVDEAFNRFAAVNCTKMFGSWGSYSVRESEGGERVGKWEGARLAYLSRGPPSSELHNCPQWHLNRFIHLWPSARQIPPCGQSRLH